VKVFRRSPQGAARLRRPVRIDLSLATAVAALLAVQLQVPANAQQPAGAPRPVAPVDRQARKGPLEIIVKFRNDGDVKPIVDLYWKDAAAARLRFNAFRKGRAYLAETELRRVTYSGELVLALSGKAAPDPAAARALAKRLSATADIAYAELDATAHIDRE
jgi:hypothetical protein